MRGKYKHIKIPKKWFNAAVTMEAMYPGVTSILNKSRSLMEILVGPIPGDQYMDALTNYVIWANNDRRVSGKYDPSKYVGRIDPSNEYKINSGSRSELILADQLGNGVVFYPKND